MGFERITVDPAKMRCVACIRDSWIPVGTVLGQLAAGRTPGQILVDFPDLEPDDIPAALELRSCGSAGPEIPFVQPA